MRCPTFCRYLPSHIDRPTFARNPNSEKFDPAMSLEQTCQAKDRTVILTVDQELYICKSTESRHITHKRGRILRRAEKRACCYQCGLRKKLMPWGAILRLLHSVSCWLPPTPCFIFFISPSRKAIEKLIRRALFRCVGSLAIYSRAVENDSACT